MNILGEEYDSYYGLGWDSNEEEPETYGARFTVIVFESYYDDNGKLHDFDRIDFNSWEDAIRCYTEIDEVGFDVWLKDNEYEVTLHNGDWS